MKAWNWLREQSVMIVAILVIFYMLAPIAVIAVFSFNDPTGRFNFEWVGFTTQYWQDPFRDLGADRFASGQHPARFPDLDRSDHPRHARSRSPWSGTSSSAERAPTC